MGKTHSYATRVHWTAGDGEGTTSYRSYSRNHEISAAGRPEIAASSDPAFRGDAARYNPEELLVASLSACHMLWFLHLCAVNGVTVVDYLDDASGVMEENADGSGQFARVTLRPSVTVSTDSDDAKLAALHEEAHHFCQLARSMNFPVEVEPQAAKRRAGIPR
jgi:organic hydroperoxide reductase OsmC/OhrA